MIARIAVGTVLVRSPDATALRDALLREEAVVSSAEPGVLQVSGVDAARIAALALAAGIVVHELTPRRAE